MERKSENIVALGTMLTLLLLGSLTVAFNVRPVGAGSSSVAQEVVIEWKMKASLPIARRNAPLAVFDTKIFAFGGIDATGYVSVVHKYDPATDTWTNPTYLPEPRGGSGVALVNDKIYVIGGSWSSAYPYSQTWEYDPIANSWDTAKSSKPTMGHAFGVAVLDNKIYTFGGFMGPAGTSNVVEVYDPSTDTWSTKGTMPWQFGGMGTAVINSKIYLIGGGPGGPVPFDLVAEYDPVTNTWSTKTSMPTARGDFANGVVAPVIDNKIYIAGGVATGPNILNSVEIYDPSTDTWSTGTPMPTPVMCCSSVAVANKIYVIGGCVDASFVPLDINQEGSVAAPQAHPTANFTYSPIDPHTGETVTFDASASSDPDGTIISYLWDFGDGATGNGITATHVYAAGGIYTVAFTAIDNDGLNATSTANLTVARTTLDITVKVGAIHFRGEIADFYIVVSSLGKPIDPYISATLYYSGNLYQNLTTSIEHVGQGLYRIPYTMPLSASTGTYALVVEAHYLTVSGISLETFLLSPTLTGWNAQLTSINGTVATIKTDLGEVKVDINNINAKLTALDNTVATIQTDIGEITTGIATIQLRVTSINGTIATIQTTLGTINGQITSIQGDVATIKTDVGTVKASLPKGWIESQQATATSLYIVMAIVLLASVGTMLLTFFRRRKP